MAVFTPHKQALVPATDCFVPRNDARATASYILSFFLQQTYRSPTYFYSLMHQTFSEENFHHICDLLSEKDSDLQAIITQHGYPPMWSRPNIFQTLILTILEQQVSLASAYAAYKKLREKIGFVTPKKILDLSAEDLRSCYFSRQKIVYAKELATAITEKKITLKKLSLASDEDIRTTLTSLKGIGDWTVDIYLIHALNRTDLFPLGDVALVNSLKEIKQLHKQATKAEMLAVAESWRPYRTIATMILWHHYIKKRGLKIQA